MVLDNPVTKIEAFLAVMNELHIHPEFECFDVGIVRSSGMCLKAGLFTGLPELSFVMGVVSGMPCDTELLALLPKYAPDAVVWRTFLIGRCDIWPVHQKTAELGGMFGSGLEDSFYLPIGEKATGNGVMIQALAVCARPVGRNVTNLARARMRLGLHQLPHNVPGSGASGSGGRPAAALAAKRVAPM